MYFSDCSNVAEVKKLYRELALKHHPDRGGDLRTMQAINAEYHNRLKGYDGVSYRGTDGKDHKYSYNFDIEQELIDKISVLLSLKMKEVAIEVIGSWLWVYGKTRPHKEALKKLSFRWHSKRSMWYYHKKSWYRREYSGLDFNTLRAMYGSKQFEQSEEQTQTLPA